MSRLRTTLIPLLTVGLIAAGCSSDDGSKSAGDDAPSAGAQQTVGGGELTSTWPLTGEQVGEGDSSALDHPIFVTKIDNTSSSEPQVGLGSADLVVEELVEGGLTRLAAFFYSSLPKQVGPVRSMRASDIGIVSPAKAEVVTSGAAGPTIARIDKAGIKFYADGDAALYRESGRSAPYNMFAHLSEIGDRAKGKAARPADYLPFGKPSELPKKAAAARTIAARFSNSTTTQWRYTKGGYQNANSHAPASDRFEPDNVLVLRTRTGDAGYLDPAGNTVPETIFEGKGEAVLFHGGKAYRGTWSKDGLDGALELSAGKDELIVPTGRTWIELVPAQGGDVTFK